MRRVIVLLMLALAGCGGGTTETPNPLPSGPFSNRYVGTWRNAYLGQADRATLIAPVTCGPNDNCQPVGALYNGSNEFVFVMDRGGRLINCEIPDCSIQNPSFPSDDTYSMKMVCTGKGTYEFAFTKQ